jgi:hypothetical protein
MCPPTPLRLVLAAVTVTLAALILAGPASASSIMLARSPAPPAAVLNDGAHRLSWSATIDHTGTTANRYTVKVVNDCNNLGLAGQAGWTITPYSLYTFQPTDPNPFSVSGTVDVPASVAAQRYCLVITFYDDASNTFSARAGVAFDVTNAVGTVRLTKFEDANGDGIRQASEAGLPNWSFQVTAPPFNGLDPETSTVTTTGDGTATMASVRTGAYTTSELLPNPNPENWTPTTSASAAFTLTSGETRDVVVGNARPSSLCGTVFYDKNGNGRRDVDDPGIAGTALALGGRSGLGIAVAGTTQSDQTGHYCFGGLLPGAYSVSETVPEGYQAVFDKDGAGNGLTLIAPINLFSGQPSNDNDFGLARPTPTTALCVTKNVVTTKVHRRGRTRQPAVPRVRQGYNVSWNLTVANCGAAPAIGVGLTDPLLADTTLGAHKDAAVVRGAVVWPVGDLAPGQSKTYTFTTKFDRDAKIGAHVNTATAAAENTVTAQASAKIVVVRTKRKAKHIAVTG